MNTWSSIIDLQQQRPFTKVKAFYKEEDPL